MCTVSYIKHDNGFSLTSNRDEQFSRPTIIPETYHEKGQHITYPKDKVAGGTWIASSDKNISVCLLNGGFINHKRLPEYAKSRGKVLKERFEYDTNSDFIEHVNLINVEPFTLLLIDYNEDIDFKALIWDGQQKHINIIDGTKNHIWCSSTLYDNVQKEKRQNWFNKFLDNQSNISTESIINFHSGSYTKDSANDMVMERGNALKTLSITQINILEDCKQMIYKDLENKKTYTTNLDVLCKVE
jgi:uncharacterized protein with NRDE domain